MQLSGLFCRNISRFQYFLGQKHVVYFPAFGNLLSLKKNVVNQICYRCNIMKERTTFRVDQRDIIKNLPCILETYIKKIINFFSTDQIIIVQVKGLPAVLNYLFSCAKGGRLLVRRHGCSKATSKPNLTKCNFLVTDEKTKCNRRLFLNQYRALATELV